MLNILGWQRHKTRHTQIRALPQMSPISEKAKKGKANKMDLCQLHYLYSQRKTSFEGKISKKKQTFFGPHQKLKYSYLTTGNGLILTNLN